MAASENGQDGEVLQWPYNRPATAVTAPSATEANSTGILHAEKRSNRAATDWDYDDDDLEDGMFSMSAVTNSSAATYPCYDDSEDDEDPLYVASCRRFKEVPEPTVNQDEADPADDSGAANEDLEEAPPIEIDPDSGFNIKLALKGIPLFHFKSSGESHGSKQSNTTNGSDNSDSAGVRPTPDDASTTLESSTEPKQSSPPLSKLKIIRRNVKNSPAPLSEILDNMEYDYRCMPSDDAVKSKLHNIINTHPDPLGLVVYFARHAYFDYCSKRKSLAQMTLDVCEKWLLALHHDDHPEVTLAHRNDAMNFVVSCGVDYVQQMDRIFHLKEGDQSYLVTHIKRMIKQRKKYKEASILIVKLNLRDSFEAKDILLPLITSDKLQCAEVYVEDSPKDQKNFISFLDHLCGKTNEELLEFASKERLVIKDNNKFQQSALTKLVERLVAKFNLNPEDFPNVYSKKNKRSLHYILNKKYKEEREGKNTNRWDDMIEVAITRDPSLRDELLATMRKYGDRHGADMWQRFITSLEAREKGYIDPTHNQMYSASTTKMSSDEGEDWSDDEATAHYSGTFSDEEDEFLEFPLSLDQVTMVETKDHLDRVLPVIFKSGNIVGFDAEWKPIVCQTDAKDKLALLQLAIRDHVYLIDMMTLEKCPDITPSFHRLFQLLLTSSLVKKLGFGIQSDFTIILNTFPDIKPFFNQVDNLIDLCESHQEMLQHRPLAERLYQVNEETLLDRGLSLMVYRCLGKPLDKRCQVSNWERRPLGRNQVKYAALDAYCLLQVYDLISKCVKNDRRLWQLLNKSVTFHWMRVKEGRRRKNKPVYTREEIEELISEQRPSTRRGPPRPPASLSIITDTMLQGLGRYLRCCGVNSRCLGNGESHREAVQISKKENRVIVTKGMPFRQLQRCVPRGMCISVAGEDVKQQAQTIFKMFNIVVSSDDIFSRCQSCNSADFLAIPLDELKIAWLLQKQKIDYTDVYANSYSSDIIDYKTLELKESGIPIKCDFIAEEVFSTVELFHCCSNCGKFYWKGHHYDSAKERL